MEEPDRWHRRHASRLGEVSLPDDPVLLDSYAAIRCPVKVQNHFDTSVSLPDRSALAAVRASSEAQAERFNSREIIDQALDRLAAIDGALDLRLLAAEDLPVIQDATRDAVARGVPLIIAPKLPIDYEGHRIGSPSVLLRGDDHSDSVPGYLPVQVKAKRMLERHSRPHQLSCSPLSRPWPGARIDMADARLRTGRENDQLQLAHFWRLLEAAGWQSAGEPTAGIIGTDSVRRTFFTEGERAGEPALGLSSGPGSSGLRAVAWVELTRKQIRTFSRTSDSGWRLRSPLERYDHEHGFRVNLARAARERARGQSNVGPMVKPIVVRECSSCQWWGVCAPIMGTDDLSVRIDKSPLDVREVSVLRSLGIQSVHDLATTDLEALLPRYLPEVRHRDHADQRIALAARRARMISRGVDLERTTRGAIGLPSSGIEIDWDIETSADDRIYLWGFWVAPAGDWHAGRYQWFGEFCDLDAAGEIELATRAMSWLTSMLTDDPATRVYHYSDYEMVHLHKLVQASGKQALRQASDLLRGAHVDLFSIVKKHFFGLHGLGLKKVATSGAGFSWRDDSPGGLNSQSWFAEAAHGADTRSREDARQRVLDYNEDDVRATAALRAWLRTQHGNQDFDTAHRPAEMVD
ncbi:TM0106 family RecB-like putative nuclease [Brooklawnia sp.]|uniref:TM0106 family RecB-like putative nuclease n=1 Tax=Brooklawnia sp. TaxID=2699740 RepID=UPI00312022F0